MAAAAVMSDGGAAMAAEQQSLASRRPVIRGLYDIRDNDVDEDVDNSMFREVPGGLLRFDTKEQCKAFMLKHCRTGSNPEFPFLQHMFTMLVTWGQVEKYLLGKVRERRQQQQQQSRLR
jgi:hypothetical protein